MKILTKEAVRKLMELEPALTEECHYQADLILLEYLYAIGETEVAQAYEKVRDDASFLYS
jgi:hypothetical protein